jgi:two-component system, cell cycle response regulator
VRVLVVDDDVSIAEMLSIFLSKEGFQVVTAIDALQAIAILEDPMPIDAVITDLMMPHLDGRALVRRIRSNPRTHSIPVLLVTAFYRDESVDAVLREGASLYLPKPVDLHMLATLLKFAKAPDQAR